MREGGVRVREMVRGCASHHDEGSSKHAGKGAGGGRACGDSRFPALSGGTHAPRHVKAVSDGGLMTCVCDDMCV